MAKQRKDDEARPVGRVFYGPKPPADAQEGDVWFEVAPEGESPGPGRPFGSVLYRKHEAQAVFVEALAELKRREQRVTQQAVATEAKVSVDLVRKWQKLGWVSLPKDRTPE